MMLIPFVPVRMASDKAVLVSVDIGIKNYGMYVESIADREPLYLENIDLSPYTVQRLVMLLDGVLSQYDVSRVIVEQQMAVNAKARIVLAHLEAYVCIKHPKARFIVLSARSKGLGKQVSSYKERKALSVSKALEYFQDNHRFKSKLLGCKKKDDMSDAVCQAVAYFSKLSSSSEQ